MHYSILDEQPPYAVIEVDPRTHSLFMANLTNRILRGENVFENRYINADGMDKAVTGSDRTTGLKDSNPKDALGIKKVPFSAVPANVVAEIAVGMAEGALKYGRHNYRVIGVRSSVYYDAALRHLMAWWEGEDIDPESGVPHVVKAITSLVVLRDAMLNNRLEDDRPPTAAPFMQECNNRIERLHEKYPQSVPAYTRKG